MTNSKTFNVARNTIIGICNSLILLVLNLLSRKLFLQYIGIEYLSVAQVINNLLTVFSFTELGVSNAVLFMLYEPVSTGNYEEIQKIIWLYRKFNRYVALAIGISGIFFIPFLCFFIKTQILTSTIYIIYILNLLTSISSYFYTYRMVLLAANQKDYISSLVSTCFSFVRIIIQCILIYLTHDYLLYLIIGIIASILQNSSIYFLVGKMYPFIKKINKQKIEDGLIETKIKLIKNISSMVSVKIAGIVINNTDNILVSWINTTMVGICSNYTTISLQLKNLITIFHSSLLHSIGIACAEKNPEEKFQIFNKILLINTLVVGVISVCLGTLWNDFIVIWIGTEYLVSPIIFQALLLNFCWNLMIAPIWLFRDANGMFIYVKKMLLINAITNILLSLFLGYFLGVGGVYIATVLADIFTDFWYDSNLIFKKVLKQRNGLYYQFYILENIFFILLISLAFNYVTKNWPINIFIWISKAIIIIFIYFVCFILKNRYSKSYQDIKREIFIPYIRKFLRNIIER